ncbi:MAG: beta-galactosidase [Lachnospiraceae bacterium]|nr:beta-galactosidase [Lachnospiraceae bacterium]
MKIGVDYYPEHWDKALWEKDADLMQKTGVEVVRMGEFAWCRFEPAEGEYDFTWLDEIMDIFAERKIDVVLCTPTNCPPLWLYEKYPDAVMTGRDGHKIATGIRGHRCYNNPDFIRHSKQIIEKMTRRYANHKSVIAWQIDNELEANFCHCEICIGEFRQWLKEKYGSIEAVNKAYGNNMWSGEYSAWEQIKPAYGSHPYAWFNPSFMLDFNRYASDNMIKYVKMQAEIIRKNCPGTMITTNTWFCENMPDFYKTFQDLDFVSYDNYPITKIPENSEEYYSHAFHLDLMRGIKRQNFWIMEQLSGGMGCWMPMVHTPRPRMIKGYSLQALAHGADTVVHFRWRTAVSGAEMFWHGLIDHSNVPGRRFDEFAQLCKQAKELDFIDGTEIKSQVAILYSSDNEYAFKIQPQTRGMYYLEQMKLFHAAFSRYGINVDIIGQHEAFDGYKIIVAPQMYVTDEDVVKRLYEFTKTGGSVILTNRSGVKDENNKCIMSPLPTVFKNLAGVCVEEYDPIGEDTVALRFADGSEYKGRQWCDVLCAENAKVLATYDSQFYKGKAAITENVYGEGLAYYVGTVGEKKLYNKLVKEILLKSKVDFIDGLPENVEVTIREGNGKKVRFIFNDTDNMQTFSLKGKELCLAPFEMQIELLDK